MRAAPSIHVPKPAQIGLFLGGVAAIVASSRLLRKRNAGAAERLAAALLNTAQLESARRDAHGKPEQSIIACIGYIAHLTTETGVSAGKSRQDPAEAGCRQTHPFSGARASVITDRSKPEEAVIYTLDFDGVCSVRGARSVGPVRLAGVTPARRLQDRVQIDLGDQYTVQFETDFNVADFIATGSHGVQGEMTAEDNRGATCTLSVNSHGDVTGSMRKGGRLVGRFAGTLGTETDIQFLAFHSGFGEERA
jgi:hypothetical protein